MKSFIKVLDSDYLVKDNGVTICTIKYKIQINRFPPILRWVAKTYPKIRERFKDDRFSVAIVKCNNEDKYDEKIGKRKAFIKALSMAHIRFLEEDIEKLDRLNDVLQMNLSHIYQINAHRWEILNHKLKD